MASRRSRAVRDARWFEETLAATDDPVMSAGTLQELVCVLSRKHGCSINNSMDFAVFVAKTAQAQGIRIAHVDSARAALGAAGWIRFRSRPANLNYGDAFAYALAIDLYAPILCKGQDFINTNAQVLRPPTQN